MFIKSVLLVCASTLSLFTPALAQSSTTSASNATVSLYLGGGDPQPVVASVVSANPTVTAYFLNCAPGTDASDCGLGMGLNLTVTSQSIYDVNYSQDVNFSFSQRCTWMSSAVCVETASGSDANFPGTSTETYPAESASLSPVTITAGLQKLAAATSSASSGSSRASGSTSASRSGSSAANPTGKSNAAVGLKIEFTIGLVGIAGLIFAQS